MKTCPEPLHPLRSWREIWQAYPISSHPALREPANISGNQWKQARRPSFRWLTQLLNRESE